MLYTLKNGEEDKYLKMILTIGAYFYFSIEGRVTSVKTLSESSDGKGLIFTSSYNDTQNGYFYLLQDASALQTNAFASGAQVEASLEGLEGINYTYMHKPPELIKSLNQKILSPPNHNIHAYQGGFVYMKDGLFIWHPIGEAKRFINPVQNKPIGLLQSESNLEKHFEESKLCRICFTKQPRCVLHPCGHIFCEECCDALLGQQISIRKCYKCGKSITYKTKINL